ncbi:MAG: NADPH-dependent F420 reductase [Candidatus Nanopelagicales bacterium]|nr:NADPH-dependent F420 reductase [Candidatus Nanopelagicales bacterium]
MNQPSTLWENIAGRLPLEPTVAILGGTGDQGMGLAYRLGASGVPVLIGSRDQDRARAAATAVGQGVSGMSNLEAAAKCDIGLVAVPWGGHESLLRTMVEALEGKIVIDCVNPLGFDKRGAFAIPVPEGSAAQQAQEILVGSVVVGAFHNVSAVVLLDRQRVEVRSDVLVLGDVRGATDIVCALADRIPGMRGVYAGRLRNCGQAEALTANLISINRRYKSHAGIRITDLPR